MEENTGSAGLELGLQEGATDQKGQRRRFAGVEREGQTAWRNARRVPRAP